MEMQKRRHADSSSAKGRSSLWAVGIDPTPACDPEKALAIFQPDVLTMERFLARCRTSLHLDPERSLMFAVLHDAVICFQENVKAIHPEKRRLYQEAEEWLWNTDRGYLFSFENICELLGFDPSYLRRGLMAWKASAWRRDRRRRSVNHALANLREVRAI